MVPPALPRKASLVVWERVVAIQKELEQLRRLIKEEEEGERPRDFHAGFCAGYMAARDGEPFPSSTQLEKIYSTSLFKRCYDRYAGDVPSTSTRSAPSTSRPRH
ncbi:hypothetical protein QJS04_geneDACA012696 [Acorus gramineus]|uniref:Uncharacterized protein n=1 Tax=Acorus gramineus TaxID=55184 RepID=A0AAV9B480_ACOGR|nr:hypothetical protein QJS04_geneDACA012696 [Acorus gramineus]